MRTLIWYLYFWGYMLVHWPALHKGLKALEAGDWKAGDELAALHVPHWANRLLKLAGVTTEVIGLENIPKDRPCVFAANHRSYYDIAIMLTQLDAPHGLVAKKEVGSIPLVRGWMRLLHCVLTNMCMVYDGDKVLVQNRVKSSWSGVTFPGGHVEPAESFVDSVIREVKEETGLTIQNVKLCGIKQFIKGDGAYRYIVFFFKTDDYSGSLASSEEGEVFWVKRQELGNYTLAKGFESMLEVFENDDLSENYNWLQDGLWRQQNK